MQETLFTGSGVAIVTPFNDTGIDYGKLGELIEFQIANKTDAIIICGTTGESSTMTDEEHIKAIKYTVDAVNKRIPVIAGTGSNDTCYCAELSRQAEADGADGLLIVTPYYNKATQKGLMEHYFYIADRVNLPIILYNVPSRTGVNIKPETLKILSEHPNITGIKEASGDIAQVANMASLCGDIDIYSGNDDMIVPVMSLGGKGVISVIANIMPEQVHNMVQKYLDGNIEESRKIQLELMPLVNALFIEVNPIPVKTAMNLMGFETGPLRMPLCSMEEKNLAVLKETLLKYGLLCQ